MTQKKESANMNAAKEAGAKVHKAVHKIAKLIENSATEEEAFALWGAFADGVDQFGSGDRLCTEEVWNYVDWCKVQWARDYAVIPHTTRITPTVNLTRAEIAKLIENRMNAKIEKKRAKS